MLLQSVIALFALLPIVASAPQVSTAKLPEDVLTYSNATAIGAGPRAPLPLQLLPVKSQVRPTKPPPRLRVVPVRMMEKVLLLQLPQSPPRTFLPRPVPSLPVLPLLLPPLEVVEITGNRQ